MKNVKLFFTLIFLMILAVPVMAQEKSNHYGFDTLDCQVKHKGHPHCFSNPVVLKEFKITTHGEFPLLIWDIASEKNNDHFTIQRSRDAISWYDVALIYGRGTTQEPKKYSFIDENRRLNGKIYYRLVQVDQDGTETMLGVKVTFLDFRTVEGFKVPAPVIRYGYYAPTGASASDDGFKILKITTETGVYTFKIISK